jgi:hypothetical protein
VFEETLTFLEFLDFMLVPVFELSFATDFLAAVSDPMEI